MVRPIVVIEMPVMVVAIPGAASSAASYWVFAASWGTILRHRQRNPTDEQRGDDREAFYGSHCCTPELLEATHPGRATNAFMRLLVPE
jgi:hypothetical protein